MGNIEDIKKECERYRLLYENADNSLAYWETKCRRLEIENEQMKFQLDNAPLGLLDTYKQAMKEIREYAIDLIDGVKGGCETDIGTILLERIDKVIGE